MRTRNFHTTMKTRPFECSVMVLSYLARLFEIFFRWISGAPGLHLASDVDSTNIPMVDGTIYGPAGPKGTFSPSWQPGGPKPPNISPRTKRLGL